MTVTKNLLSLTDNYAWYPVEINYNLFNELSALKGEAAIKLAKENAVSEVNRALIAFAYSDPSTETE